MRQLIARRERAGVALDDEEQQGDLTGARMETISGNGERAFVGAIRVIAIATPPPGRPAQAATYVAVADQAYDRLPARLFRRSGPLLPLTAR